MQVLALLSTVPVAAGMSACGGAGRNTSSRSGVTATVEHVLTVSRELGPIDADDYPILNFGHSAGAAEKRTITALVKRYYAAAAASDGAKACSMLYVVAVREVLEQYGRSPGTRGTTCAVVVSKLFHQRHRRIVADAGSLKVVRVRADRLSAYVILRFATAATASEIDMRRIGGAWEIQRPLAVPVG